MEGEVTHTPRYSGFSPERNIVAVENLRSNQDRAKGVATALKGLRELMKKNYGDTAEEKVVDEDKIGLQISPRGAAGGSDSEKHIL